MARLYDVFPGSGVTRGTTATRYTDESGNSSVRKTVNDFNVLHQQNLKDSAHRRYFHKIYIPGVGTPFPEVGDNNNWMQNKAGEGSGAYGNERIIWALWQTINLAIRASGEQILDAKEINGFAKQQGRYIREPDIQNFFRQTLNRYASRLQNARKPTIRIVKLYVFGFSRGAAAARSYCTRLENFLAGQKIGFKFKVIFLGIFDTVASVGIARSGGGDGHFDWAHKSLMFPKISTCIHMVSTHEVRGSFPLTSVQKLGGNVEEIVYPGVHSDIGGGYTPYEQGKSLTGNGDTGKLSQIPLADMYRKALLSGVPLLIPDEWSSNTNISGVMQADRNLIKAFNDYHTASKSETIRKKSLTEIIRCHYAFYLQWRKLRYGKLAIWLSLKIKNPNNKTANSDYADIQDGDAGLKYELDFMNTFKSHFKMIQRHNQPPRQELIPPTRRKLEGELPLLTKLESAMKEKYRQWSEEGIRKTWQDTGTLSPSIIAMFDDYVHDSRAWFRIESPEAWGYLRHRHIY